MERTTSDFQRLGRNMISRSHRAPPSTEPQNSATTFSGAICGKRPITSLIPRWTRLIIACARGYSNLPSRRMCHATPLPVPALNWYQSSLGATAGQTNRRSACANIRGKTVIRNRAWGLMLLLTLLSGNAQTANRESKSQKTSAEGPASSPAAAPVAGAPSPMTADSRKPGSEFKDCALCPPMVVVPSGQFVMGSPSGEAGRADNEGPPHTVTIAGDFALGKYEITFDDWDACVTDRRCARADDSGFGRGRRPVINVSHENAKGYIAWLSGKTNQNYRLPTEAEWEYAARAGSDGPRFWGISPDVACQYANVFNQATLKKYQGADIKTFRCDDGYVETAPVGSFKPNRFGLYDMLGNVWEWVEDCWNGSYAGAPTDGSANRTGDCSKRVLRGGGWYYGPNNLRSAKRLRTDHLRQGNDVGFRVARTLR